MKTKNLSSLLLLVLLTFMACQEDDSVSVSGRTSAKGELEAKLKTEFTNSQLPSIAYCVVKNDKILHSGALGFADKANNRLATANTRYLIASVSKPVTAVAAMKLVEQNLIKLDDDINQYLPFSVKNPNFPNDKITLRMLLAHTSSISDDPVELLDLNCYGIDCAMSLEQYLREVLLNTGEHFSPDMFLNKKPGTVRDYSNVGSALVGYLVERVAKTPFDVYCKNNIFTPLNMTKTEWRLANIPISELAIPYSNKMTNTSPHYTAPDYPNGGLRTTVLDLSIFLRMVIQKGSFNGKQILSQATITEMETLQFGSDIQGLSFFYDTINGSKVLGHTGGEQGVTTMMFYNPSNKVGVIVFCNQEDADLDSITSLLFDYGDKQ
jgi:CubicO group peptidase (beta-lactamase class C family)